MARLNYDASIGEFARISLISSRLSFLCLASLVSLSAPNQLSFTALLQADGAVLSTSAAVG